MSSSAVSSSKLAGRSMKAESATKSGGGGKPNAWSKPLQSTKTSTNTVSAKRFTNSNKPGNSPDAPPGLTPPTTEAAAASNGTSTANRFLNSNNNGDSNSSMDDSNSIALRERFLHLLLTVTGHSVTVSLKSGATYTGVLHTATPFAHLPDSQKFKYVLKAVSSPHDASVEGKTLILNMKEVVQVQVKSCRLDSLVQQSKGGSNDAFTDTEISGATAMNRDGKDLVSAGSHWTSEPIASGTVMKTNSRAGALKGSIADWDQFKANEELFNVTANYDENVYTTALDHSNISREDKLRAAEIARAIESSVTTNMHLAEERGQVLSQDYDEEDRYSGVLKSTTAVTAATPAPVRPTAVAGTKLNYAAVAKTRPPGFGGDNKAVSATKVEPKEEKSAPKESVEKTAPPVSPEPAPAANEVETKEEASPPPPATPATAVAVDEADKEGEEVPSTPETKVDEEEKAETPKSKLNVNAKEFSFNINAKVFTPGVPSGMVPPPPPPPPQYIDPNTGYPIMPMHMPHGMMQPMMGLPGAFPGMRYPQYPGMEQMQHMPQHQHMHGQPVPPPPPVSCTSPSGGTSGTTSPVPISDEGSTSQQPVPQPQEGDAASETSSQAASQQQQQQLTQPPPPPLPPQHVHQMPMYMQQGYYPGGQMMHPGHQPQQFMHPAQLAAMQHQQRQMGYPMQPGHMPPNMMRAPNGMPYYAGPGGPMPYPPPYGVAGPYGEDPNLDGGMNPYGGRGGRGGAGGRVGRGGARQGRGPRGGPGRTGRGGGLGGGRLGYQQQPSGGYASSSSSQPGSGRQTPQQQQPPHPQPGYNDHQPTPPPLSSQQPPDHEVDPPVEEAPAAPVEK